MNSIGNVTAAKQRSLGRTNRIARYYMDHRSIAKTVGQNLRRIRIAERLTQKRMGDLLGVSGQQVQKYESGESQLSVSRLIQFCWSVGVSPDHAVAGLMPRHPFEDFSSHSHDETPKVRTPTTLCLKGRPSPL